MAAAAWKVYNRAKTKIMNGTVDLDTAVMKMGLYKDGGNASTFTLSLASQLLSAVTGGGYTGAKTLTCSVVSVNASTAKFKFNDVIFTASSASITSILHAVIYVSSGAVICWSKLSTTQFSVSSNNTLTISANATNGAFTISGGTT